MELDFFDSSLTIIPIQLERFITPRASITVCHLHAQDPLGRSLVARQETFGDLGWYEVTLQQFYAVGKAASLLSAHENTQHSYVTGPSKRIPSGHGIIYPGVIAHDRDYVAVSGLTPQADLLLAATLLYMWRHNSLGGIPIMLHHVGRRHATRESFDQAVRSRQDGVSLPAEDHERYYWRSRAYPHSYGEDEFCRTGPHNNSVHFDLTFPSTEVATTFLMWVASQFEQEAELWDDAGPNDPVGAFWVPLDDGNNLGVMARGGSWSIPGL